MFKELYQYRELLKSNIKKEIRGKYKGSFLGVLWSFVNPLLSVLIYAIVFPFILRDSQPNYVTFLVIGVLPWSFFTTVVNQGTTSIIYNGGIIKKVYFPREILPISIVTSGVINFLISCLIIFIFLIASGIGFSLYILWLPVIIIIQYLLLLGIIFITGAVNVYVRDSEYIITFFVNMLFYATPILYNPTLFPEKFRWILHLNPLSTIITSYRDIFFYKHSPNLFALLLVGLFSIFTTLIGYAIFQKLKKGFAEEL